MSANLKHKYTLEEYFELDRTSEERWEYFDGEVFRLSGVSEAHGEIETNIIFSLKSRLDNAKCRVFPANIRLKVPAMPPYRYADVSALCGAAKFEKIGGVDVLTNPQLIIEILSDSTAAYDRGAKFTQYKSVPTFNEYLLIAQDRASVTQIFKRDDEWIYRDFEDMETAVHLPSLDCKLQLSEIYRNVEFPPDDALEAENLN